MKTKNIEHEQYCKHYERKDGKFSEAAEEAYRKEVEKLESMIQEQELKNGRNPMNEEGYKDKTAEEAMRNYNRLPRHIRDKKTGREL